MVSDWFYFLPRRSLHNFEEITEAFLEVKKNNHHLLTVKMRQSDNLKSYISYFQNQLTKIPSCGEDVSELAFINELQISHPLCKHLLKHNVTQMSEVLSRAQPYSSWRKRWRALPTSFSNATMTERSWSHNMKLQSMSLIWIGGNPPTKDMHFRSFHRIHSSLQDGRALHSAETPHQRSLQCYQGPSVCKVPKPIQYNPTLPGAKEYCSYHNSKGHQTVHCRSLQKYLDLFVKTSSKSTYLPPRQPPMQDSRALCLLPNRDT